MERILICSDIHRRQENFLAALQESQPIDRIIIAGDIEADPRGYERITGMTPLVMVQGNCDWYLGEALPLTAFFDLEGHHFFVTHGHRFGVGAGKPYALVEEAKRKGADLVVFGHSHRVVDETWEGIRFLNPGSLRGNRDVPACTYMVLELSPMTLEVTLKQI